MSLQKQANDRAVRQAALTRLAVATRERLPEAREDRDAFLRVYLDDLTEFSTDTFVAACRYLETTADWFPKKHELIDACQAIVKRRLESSSTAKLLQAPAITPVPKEKLDEFMAQFRAVIHKKAM